MFETGFPAAELTERRSKVLDAIGDQALAVLQGADSSKAMGTFRQYNEFYYLCGIEVPHAYLVLNGKSRRSILFLPRASQIAKEHDGEAPSADNPACAKALAGVDGVRGPEHSRPHL